MLGVVILGRPHVGLLKERQDYRSNMVRQETELEGKWPDDARYIYYPLSSYFIDCYGVVRAHHTDLVYYTKGTSKRYS